MSRTRKYSVSLSRLTMLAAMCMCAVSAMALSFNLDSIKEWGAFPRFCVDTYRWGDKFFNGYDTAYVKSSGYKFNAKLRTEGWIETYHFYLPDEMRLNMRSEPTTSAGLWLQYLAVSAGYDKNVSRYFGGGDGKTRERFSFGFDCMLFSYNMYFENNKGGTNIKSFGNKHQLVHLDMPFDGLRSKSFGFGLYYFFDHKKYSQSAAFGYGRIQNRSHGSWYAGLSLDNQNFDFDFNALPDEMKDALPQQWKNEYRFTTNTRNLAVKFGYGYNWVFSPHWVLGVQESPTVGLRMGKYNTMSDRNTTGTFANQFRMSVVWNNKEWFAGAVGEWNAYIVQSDEAVFRNSVISGTLTVGYRFNLW